jgi:hypothetical protein
MGRCSAANKSEDLPDGKFSHNAFGRKAFVLIVFATPNVVGSFSTILVPQSQHVKEETCNKKNSS